jgi:hypothetical protein
MKMKKIRQTASFLLMVLGACMLVRGVENSIRRDLGWQGMIMAVVMGALVFSLGFARWRYLRQR